MKVTAKPNTTLLITAVADIAPDVDAALHLRPERARVDADHDHPDDVAAENAHRTEDRGQHRHGDRAGPETRREHYGKRVDRHHFHRRQLLAGLHQTDLGGERRARASREQQPGHDRPELAHERQRDEQPEGLLGPYRFSV